MYVYIHTGMFMCICPCFDNGETKDHISISLLENVFGKSLRCIQLFIASNQSSVGLRLHALGRI